LAEDFFGGGPSATTPTERASGGASSKADGAANPAAASAPANKYPSRDKVDVEESPSKAKKATNKKTKTNTSVDTRGNVDSLDFNNNNNNAIAGQKNDKLTSPAGAKERQQQQPHFKSPKKKVASPSGKKGGGDGSSRTKYVAPPSSESFVQQQKQQQQPTITENASVSVPPPPPPLTVPLTVVGDSNSHNSKAVVLDDDDFSVAPSLAVEMRSITNHTFDDVYQRGQKLGFGAFAMVYIGTHRPTGAKYAIKQVDRSKMFWGERDALKDEITNLQKVRAGPNIVQLYEVFEEATYCYLVTELMPGGELFDRIIEKKTFSEKEARNSIRCVLEALQYMHERRVAHRDLKPENLLLKDPNGLLPVKLADFGFAKSVEKKNSCRTLCGSKF
jgi:hypothetical protein